MDKERLWENLIPMMEQDADYQQALQRLREADADYLAILKTMASEDREVLERYIAACEALDDPLIFLAYQLGRADTALFEISPNTPSN